MLKQLGFDGQRRVAVGGPSSWSGRKQLQSGAALVTGARAVANGDIDVGRWLALVLTIQTTYV